MSKDELLSVHKASELLKDSEKNFDDTEAKINSFKIRIENISKKLKESRHKFSKSNIIDIKTNLYEIKNERNPSALRIKEIEKYLLKSEKNLFKSKKYYDYGDAEYKGIRSIRIYLICQLMKIIRNQ